MFSHQDGAYAPNFNLNLNNKCQFQLNNYPNIEQRKPVGVFWDIENCCIPRGLNTFVLVDKIRALFKKFNLVEREFVVVCDVYGMNHIAINELNNMQVNIVHVCSYSKNASDEKLKQLIYRFSMVHGSYSAIILLSSDINFAPLLSDIKNRIGIFVILFHHRQVSPALLACSNYKIDFDNFCSDVPFHNPEAITFTYLTISNWPKEFNEESVTSFLNRIICNSGGRIIEVDYRNCEAMVGFKCKSDAQRCIQRVNNRKIHGFSLKANINLNPVHSKNDYLKFTKTIPNYSHDTAAQSTIPKLRILPSSSEQTKNDPLTTVNKDAVASLLQKIKANQCDMCTLKSNKRSQHANFLFKNKILSINVSLNELRQRLDRLLETHSGTLLFNCLPDCWLIEFGQEMDANTEPKVMLEHLVSCIDDVSIENLEVEVDEKIIITKCIRKANTKQPKPKLPRKQNRRLKALSQKIYSLLISNLPNKITSFPSILLKDLESMYQNKYNQSLSLESYDVENLVELAFKLDSKFNLYTYDDDYLLALNFNEQLFCFSSDINKALNSVTHQLRSELDVEDVPKLFRKYFDFDLNIAVYGVCYIEDMIDTLIKTNLFNHTKGDNLIMTPQNNFISNNVETLKVKRFNKKKWIPFFENLLKSFPNFCLSLNELFPYICANEESKNEKLYTQFVEMVRSINSSVLQILTYEDIHLIALSQKLRLIELGKRFLEIFNDLSLLGHNHPFCSNAQSIYQLYHNYVVQFRIRHFYFGLYGTSSLSILFEKILSQFYKSQVENQFCLIYTEKGVYLQKIDAFCLEEYLLHLFIILLQSTSYTLNVKDFKDRFQQTYGYHFGISLIYHHTFKQYFNLIKQTDGSCLIKLTPFYEFIAQCLTVMLMHPNILINNFDIIRNEEWTLQRLQTAYNLHFGLEMQKPDHFDIQSYQDLFKQVGFIFKMNKSEDDAEIVIQFKREDLLKYVDNKSLSTCNFCQINKLSMLNIDTTSEEIDKDDISPISTNDTEPISQSESCSPLLII